MWYILDTSLLLGGKEPPQDGRWATTPEAAAEVTPGGRDAARFERWRSNGLEIRSARQESQDRVDETAIRAGTLTRLSVADQSLIALALDMDAVLVTDDYTMLDVASRLDVQTRTVNQDGIEGHVDWKPRCTGCGRWFDEPQKKDECPICGSPVKAKRMA